MALHKSHCIYLKQKFTDEIFEPALTESDIKRSTSEAAQALWDGWISRHVPPNSRVTEKCGSAFLQPCRAFPIDYMLGTVRLEREALNSARARNRLDAPREDINTLLVLPALKIFI